MMDFKIIVLKRMLKLFVLIMINSLVMDWFLPSGPLRENLNPLKKTDLVIINGDKNEKFESRILNINPNLEIFYSFYAPIDIDQFKNNKLLAIAGIGNPENFFHLLEKII